MQRRRRMFWCFALRMCSGSELSRIMEKRHKNKLKWSWKAFSVVTLQVGILPRLIRDSCENLVGQLNLHICAVVQNNVSIIFCAGSSIKKCFEIFVLNSFCKKLSMQSLTVNYQILIAKTWLSTPISRLLKFSFSFFHLLAFGLFFNIKSFKTLLLVVMTRVEKD